MKGIKCPGFPYRQPKLPVVCVSMSLLFPLETAFQHQRLKNQSNGVYDIHTVCLLCPALGT